MFEQKGPIAPIPAQPKQEGFVDLNNDFDSPKRLIAKCGHAAGATEAGPHHENQDLLIFDKEKDVFAVIDGMGGYSGAAVAARAVAKAIQTSFMNEQVDSRKMQMAAHQNIKETGNRESAAVYLAGRLRKNGKELDIYVSGDCQLLVADDKGEVKFISERTPLSNAPSGRGSGFCTTEEGIMLKNYDVIVAASDGLWDNASSAEVAALVAKYPPEKALLEIHRLAHKRMQGDNDWIDDGKPDDLTIFIYQIRPVPLRGK